MGIASRAAVGHVKHGQLRLGLEQLHGHGVRRPDPGGTVVDGVGFCFGTRHQVLHCLNAGGGVGHQHQGTPSCQGDWREILHRIKGDVFVQLRGHQHGIGPHQYGVAIGIGLGDHVSTNVAAGTRQILHNDRLPQALAQTGRHSAGNRVHAGAGRERHHDTQLLRWPGLGLRNNDHKSTYQAQAAFD